MLADADILQKVLPRTRTRAASVYGLRGTRVRYDVPAQLAAIPSLTSVKLQVRGQGVPIRATITCTMMQMAITDASKCM